MISLVRLGFKVCNSDLFSEKCEIPLYVLLFSIRYSEVIPSEMKFMHSPDACIPAAMNLFRSGSLAHQSIMIHCVH